MQIFLIGLAAFVGGAAVSWVNYLLLRFLLKKKGEAGIGLVSPLRTILSVAYLLILFLLRKKVGLNTTVLLIGGALGLTEADLEAAVRARIPEKFHELNLRALAWAK